MLWDVLSIHRGCSPCPVPFNSWPLIWGDLPLSILCQVGHNFADENCLIILLSSCHWSKQTFILCHQSKSWIYHSQDKHFLLCILPTNSLLSKAQTPPCYEASFFVSQRYLCTKELCWHTQHPIWLLLSIPLLSPAFFFLLSAFTVIHQQCPTMVSISCLANLAYVGPLINFLLSLFSLDCLGQPSQLYLKDLHQSPDSFLWLILHSL